MQITTKFEFGDKVFLIRNTSKPLWIPCKFCAATGFITGADDSKRSCIECHGSCGRNKFIQQGWHIADQRLTIGQVQINIIGEDPVGGGDPIFTNMGPQKYKREETYFCKETGIGSGSYYHVEDLFGYRDNAAIECERRNKRDADRSD